MKYVLFATAFLFSWNTLAKDFPSRMEDAAYLATLKAVLDYKMNDEETLKDLEKLRENERFIASLEKKLSKLSNARQKNSKNKRVYQMLIQDGKKIYEELD